MSLNTCACCGDTFTDIECENGALIEKDITTFKKVNGDFREVMGSQLQCENCYSPE